MVSPATSPRPLARFTRVRHLPLLPPPPWPCGLSLGSTPAPGLHAPSWASAAPRTPRATLPPAAPGWPSLRDQSPVPVALRVLTRWQTLPVGKSSPCARGRGPHSPPRCRLSLRPIAALAHPRFWFGASRSCREPPRTDLFVHVWFSFLPRCLPCRAPGTPRLVRGAPSAHALQVRGRRPPTPSLAHRTGTGAE